MSGFGGVSYFGYASAPWAKSETKTKKMSDKSKK
jgi:hypothetical protein